MAIYNIYGRDKRMDSNWKFRGYGSEHYIGQVDARTAAQAVRKAGRDKDWHAMYGKFRVVGGQGNPRKVKGKSTTLRNMAVVTVTKRRNGVVKITGRKMAGGRVNRARKARKR